MGLYVLIAGLTMLFWKARWWSVINDLCRPEGQTLGYVIGLIALPVGLLLVLSHNYWNSGLLPLVVTIFGWIILLKSIFVFVVSPAQMGRMVKMIRMESWWYIYVVVVLVIGAYLAYSGFTG
jgi:ABC-type amino acid transport system permease subunit